MYRFLWSPRWIVSHVLVLALIVGMVNLGLWQVRRLHEKQDQNELITANSSAAPIALGAFDRQLESRSIEEVRYTAVTVRGTYDTAHEVAVRNRTNDGAPGRWIVTPLIPDDGGPAVAVLRGWVPLAVSDTSPPFEGVEPPAGVVEVTGWAQPTQVRGWLGPTDPPTGTLAEIARLDVARIDQQTPGSLEPYYLQLENQAPPTEATITSVPLPTLDEGPHLGYALQWAVFTIIAMGGYPLILRRQVGQRAAAAAIDAAVGPPDPDSEPRFADEASVDA